MFYKVFLLQTGKYCQPCLVYLKSMSSFDQFMSMSEVRASNTSAGVENSASEEVKVLVKALLNIHAAMP